MELPLRVAPRRPTLLKTYREFFPDEHTPMLVTCHHSDAACTVLLKQVHGHTCSWVFILGQYVGLRAWQCVYTYAVCWLYLIDQPEKRVDGSRI